MTKKTVVITGGNRGIGLSITKAFLNAGYDVFVGARQETEELKTLGCSVSFIECDVRSEQSVKNMVHQVFTKTKRLDVFVNNAGYSEWRPIDQIDEKFLDDIFATNLKGAFWGCKAALSVMVDGGSVINISSIAGKRGSANNSAYVATKFGMNGLTQSLAKEVGARGVRVNGICPVLVPTDGLLKALENPNSPSNGNGIDFIQKFGIDNAALKRLPTGDEVAAMCILLASQNASAVTGQNINVDCGVFPQ